jgi:hypothetical protein
MLFSPLVLNTFLLVSLVLLQQAHGLRVAVLLSGEFRTWLVTRHTYYEYLLKYNRERGHEMDVFVSTYDKTLPSDTEVTEYAKRCHETMAELVDDESKISIKPYYSGDDMADFIYMQDFDGENKLLKYLYDGAVERQRNCTSAQVGTPDCTFRGCYQLLSIQMKFHEGMKRILEEEEATGKPYDFVIKIRPDLAIFSPMDVEQMYHELTIEKQVPILFNKCQKALVGDDHIAFGLPSFMNSFASRKYLEFIEKRPGPTNPEAMQRGALDWMSIPYDYVHDEVDYLLMRTLDQAPLYLHGAINKTEMQYYFHGKWVTLCTPTTLNPTSQALQSERSRQYEHWVPLQVPVEDVDLTCDEAYRTKHHIMDKDMLHTMFDQMSFKRSCLAYGD